MLKMLQRLLFGGVLLEEQSGPTGHARDSSYDERPTDASDNELVICLACINSSSN